MDIKSEILHLKKEKGVLILAHNYQIPDVQDIADYVGDSLGLSRQAAKTSYKTILFCGVHFMAETAAITCPDKKVLIPYLAAACSLSDTITSLDVQEQLNELVNGEFLVHPECSCTSSVIYDIASGDYGKRQVQILSTECMMNYAKTSNSKKFVVATETGILYRMQKQNPGK